jgi:hypothetical protein
MPDEVDAQGVVKQLAPLQAVTDKGDTVPAEQLCYCLLTVLFE